MMLTDLGEAMRTRIVFWVAADVCNVHFGDPRCVVKKRAYMSRRWLGIAQFVIFAVACEAALAQATQSTPGPTSSTQTSDIHGPISSYQPVLQERHPQYKVMPSDVLAVSFPLSTELNQTVTVQPDGFITLANVGSVYVQGQTTPDIVETLHKAYARILHDPIIAVDLTNFQAPEFTIFGHVGRPGEYSLRRDTTVSQAIAIGGGFLPTAKSQAFLLRRVNSDWLEVKKLNLKAMTHGKNLPEDMYLQPGDMIYVPETVVSKFRQYIPYGGVSGVPPLGVANSLGQ